MPRPCRCRRVCSEPLVDVFGPASELDAGGVPPVVLLVEEYEALRIMDYEGRTHEQCAAQMRVSRTTVTEIYERARHKVAAKARARMNARAAAAGNTESSLRHSKTF